MSQESYAVLLTRAVLWAHSRPKTASIEKAARVLKVSPEYVKQALVEKAAFGNEGDLYGANEAAYQQRLAQNAASSSPSPAARGGVGVGTGVPASPSAPPPAATPPSPSSSATVPFDTLGSKSNAGKPGRRPLQGRGGGSGHLLGQYGPYIDAALSSAGVNVPQQAAKEHRSDRLLRQEGVRMDLDQRRAQLAVGSKPGAGWGDWLKSTISKGGDPSKGVGMGRLAALGLGGTALFSAAPAIGSAIQRGIGSLTGQPGMRASDDAYNDYTRHIAAQNAVYNNQMRNLHEAYSAGR